MYRIDVKTAERETVCSECGRIIREGAVCAVERHGWYTRVLCAECARACLRGFVRAWVSEQIEMHPRPRLSANIMSAADVTHHVEPLVPITLPAWAWEAAEKLGIDLQEMIRGEFPNVRLVLRREEGGE